MWQKYRRSRIPGQLFSLFLCFSILCIVQVEGNLCRRVEGTVIMMKKQQNPFKMSTFERSPGICQGVRKNEILSCALVCVLVMVAISCMHYKYHVAVIRDLQMEKVEVKLQPETIKKIFNFYCSNDHRSMFCTNQSRFVEQETKTAYHASCQNRTDTFIHFSQGDPLSIHKQKLLLMRALTIKVQLYSACGTRWIKQINMHIERCFSQMIRKFLVRLYPYTLVSLFWQVFWQSFPSTRKF